MHRLILGWSPLAMVRLLLTRFMHARSALLVLFGLLVISGPLHAEPKTPALPKQAPEKNPGHFFQITEPITHETLEQLSAATRQVIDRTTGQKDAERPILILEFHPGEKAPGSSTFGASHDLAEFISTKLQGAKLTVAYIPEPLHGYAVLPALACTEVVMGPDAALGPITPEGSAVNPAYRELIRQLAIRKTRPVDLYLGLLDRDADLRALRTANKQVHYVLPENLAEFQKNHQVVDDQPAWEGGRRGVLTAQLARERGFSQLTAKSAIEVARAYKLSGQSASNDPTLGQTLQPVWIKIDGPIDTVKKSYLGRRIEQARQDKANLIFFQFNSGGGTPEAADGIADIIVNIKDMKTVAYIDDRAEGLAALPALACHDIVFHTSGRMGDVSKIVSGHGHDIEAIPDAQVEGITRRAADIAERRGHPAAVARAMVDPKAEVVEVNDAHTGASCLVLKTQVDAEPTRYLNPIPKKDAGSILTVDSEKAELFGLGSVVNDAEQLKSIYGLRGKSIRVDGPTWVDSLVTVLTTPVVSWLLLFVGLFMLVLELKLPGIGLPAITSALAFLLFFWSHWLSGTADQLEIILFLVGMICIALELFVFPGFGVFGMSGVLLVLLSIIMASHTFIWPTQEYEYRELGYTLLQVTIAMAAVGGGAVVLARYFPSLPLFNRLILKSEPWTGVNAEGDDPTAKPPVEGYESLVFLIGETGRTTTMLRPTGKARFGELLVDVTAEGFFIEPDRLVEVTDVQGQRVIVKRVGS